MSKSFDDWSDAKDLKQKFPGKSHLLRHPSNRPYRIQFHPSKKKFRWTIRNIYTGVILEEGWAKTRMAAKEIIQPLLDTRKEDISNVPIRSPIRARLA